MQQRLTVCSESGLAAGGWHYGRKEQQHQCCLERRLSGHHADFEGMEGFNWVQGSRRAEARPAQSIGAMRRLAPAVALCPSNGCLKVCKVVA
jgi:hypothetical protein